MQLRFDCYSELLIQCQRKVNKSLQLFHTPKYRHRYFDLQNIIQAVYLNKGTNDSQIYKINLMV